MAQASHDDTPELIHRIVEILRVAFPPPSDWVDVSAGYRGNIHVAVVSERFKDLRETEKQELLWSVIEASDLSESDKHRISRILPYSPVELR